MGTTERNQFVDPILTIGNTEIDLSKVSVVGEIVGKSPGRSYEVSFSDGVSVEIYEEQKYIGGYGVMQMHRAEFLKKLREYKKSLEFIPPLPEMKYPLKEDSSKSEGQVEKICFHDGPLDNATAVMGVGQEIIKFTFPGVLAEEKRDFVYVRKPRTSDFYLCPF